jgi:hypothetical protein
VFFQQGMTQFSEDPDAVETIDPSLCVHGNKYTIRTRVEVME